MGMDIVGLALAITMSLGMVALLVWWMRRSAMATRETEEALAKERQLSWQATVTRIEIQEIYVHGAGAHGSQVKHLAVHFRRDDGLEGNVQAYENDALRYTFSGPLAYYKDAPGWDELSGWREGDRLVKPVGEIFPQKASVAQS